MGFLLRPYTETFLRVLSISPTSSFGQRLRDGNADLTKVKGNIAKFTPGFDLSVTNQNQSPSHDPNEIKTIFGPKGQRTCWFWSKTSGCKNSDDVCLYDLNDRQFEATDCANPFDMADRYEGIEEKHKHDSAVTCITSSSAKGKKKGQYLNKKTRHQVDMVRAKEDKKAASKKKGSNKVLRR